MREDIIVKKQTIGEGVILKFSKIKQLLYKYRHGYILSYFFIYLIWFTYLENTITESSNFTQIESKLDAYIPFNELFVIPYFLWFIYIFVTVAFFFLTSKQDFYKCCAFLFIGMTICLIIYTVFPNGHHLNADLDSLGRDNILIDIMRHLYKIDTSTNVFPSIHVYNSIGACIALSKSEALKKKIWLKVFVIILTVAICLSTVFLKQHSVLDIFSAVALSIVMYVVVYVPSWNRIRITKTSKQELSKISQ